MGSEPPSAPVLLLVLGPKCAWGPPHSKSREKKKHFFLAWPDCGPQKLEGLSGQYSLLLDGDDYCDHDCCDYRDYYRYYYDHDYYRYYRDY
jgi:hypothetical protein